MLALIVAARVLARVAGVARGGRGVEAVVASRVSIHDPHPPALMASERVSHWPPPTATFPPFSGCGACCVPRRRLPDGWAISILWVAGVLVRCWSSAASVPGLQQCK